MVEYRGSKDEQEPRKCRLIPNILADKYGADALRYYLMRDNIVGQDSDFSEENLGQAQQQRSGQ